MSPGWFVAQMTGDLRNEILYYNLCFMLCLIFVHPHCRSSKSGDDNTTTSLQLPILTRSVMALYDLSAGRTQEGADGAEAPPPSKC